MSLVTLVLCSETGRQSAWLLALLGLQPLYRPPDQEGPSLPYIPKKWDPPQLPEAPST